MKKLSILFSAAFILLLTGCVQKRSEPYDYSALIESKPKSILVVMPTNSSPDVKGSTSVLARATVPLAELGYYVYPVALVDETFKQNGLTDGNAIQSAGIKKIREIFGADSIMLTQLMTKAIRSLHRQFTGSFTQVTEVAYCMVPAYLK